MSLRRAVLCLAASAALAACQTPAGAPAASSDASAQQPQQQQPPPKAASAPDAGRLPPEVRSRPLQVPEAEPMPSDDTASKPPDTATGAAQPFLLRDSGVRCVTFPCPSYSVQAPGQQEAREVHELDLGALGSDEERERVQEGVAHGIRVEGTLSVRAKAGPAGSATVLRVTRLLK
jgi:hypothetical protein